MSASNVVKCACCEADVEEEHTATDPDLGVVCGGCQTALQWAHATLRRRTPQGVSIYGIHSPREQPLRWEPAIADRAYQKWLDSQEGPQI